MSKPAKNTTDGPVVIDDDGHTLGGGEWGQVDPDAHRVQDLVAAGFLVVTDHGPEDAPASAATAGEAAGDGSPAPSGSKATSKKES